MNIVARAWKAATGAAFTVIGSIRVRAGQALTLVPYYLANLLWLLSQAFLDLARNGYGANPIVYACLRLLSQSVPEPALIAYTVDDHGEIKDPVPWLHPLGLLIRQPNELMTEYEMWELVTLHLGITGRATWFKERDNAGRIIALWPLRPDRVGPIYSVDTTGGQKVLKGWSYLVPGTVEYVPLARADVWFMNLPDPAGESGGIVEGLGPLQVLALEVGADNEATKFVGSLLANYAAPGIVITTKTPLRNADQAKLIKAAFQQEFGGSRRGIPAVLDADADIKPYGFSLRDLEFPGVRAVSESRIAAAFGVPAILVGLKAGLDAGIRATISEQREYFTETTLANYWQRLSTAFTRDVAAEFGADIVCRFDISEVKAFQTQSRWELERLDVAWQKGGITFDEYREKALHLPPLGGDLGASVLLPAGATPTPAENYVPPNPWISLSTGGDDTADQEQLAVQEVERLTHGTVRQPRGRQPVPPMPPANGATGGGVNGKATLVLARPTVRAAGATSAHLAYVRQRADAVRQDALDHHAPLLADYLNRLGTRVADRVASASARKTRADDLLALASLPPGAAQELANLLDALWTEVMGQAFQDAGTTTGIALSFDVRNPEIANVMDQIATRITGIDATTAAAIRQAVEDATTEGQSIGQLAQTIRSLGVFSRNRAELIARTESGTAYNLGAAKAYRASGVVSKVHILDGTDYDEACASVNDTIQTLEWFEAHPLQHPRCVRAGAPVVETGAR